MKFLVLGDLHIKTSNISEVSIYFAKLEKYLQENPVDICISAGDCLDSHEKINAICLNKAVEYVKLTTKYAETIMLQGNHDAYFNSYFLTDNHWMNCLKHHPRLTVVDTVIIKEYPILEEKIMSDVIKNVKNNAIKSLESKDKTDKTEKKISNKKSIKIVYCPYVADGKFISALNTRKGEWEDADVIFSHVTIRGVSMNGIIAKDADAWPEKYPLLVSGHIHKKHWLAKNMYYTGSIMQVSTDEDPDKAIALVEVLNKKGQNENKITLTEIDLQVPKKVNIEMDINDLTDDYKVPSEPETKYTFYLTGTAEQYKTFKKSTLYKELRLLPQILKIYSKRKTEDIKTRNEVLSREALTQTHQTFTQLLSQKINASEDKLLFSFYNAIANGAIDISDPNFDSEDESDEEIEI